MHIIVAGSSLYTHVAGTSVFTSVATPSGVTTHSTVRPTFSRYLKNTVVNGTLDPGVVWSEVSASFRKLGFTAPAAAITVAAGSGTGISASCRAYLVPVEKSGTTIIARGNPSPPSNAVTLSDQGIAYSAIPATATDARTTHYEIYREDDGILPRLDVTVTLGTTTATSNNSTNSLDLATALPSTGSGATDTLARGAPPYCQYNETYHDRMWYAGDPNFPQRTWYSRTGEMESVRTTSWIDTRDGEAVTGIKRVGDQLVIFCAGCSYAIQGYSDGTDGTDADLTMVKISPDVGCLSHHAIVTVGSPGGGDMIMFPSQEGVSSYNGSYFRFMMDDLRTYWRDAYLADKANFEDSFAAYDHHWNTYKLGIPGASSTRYYVGHMLPVWEGAQQPDWVFDIRGRRDYAIGNLTTTTTTFAMELHTGSSDGYVRQENQDSVAADDGIAKTTKVRWKHYFFGGPSGGINHGSRYELWDLYAKNENDILTVNFYCGDELAGDAATPSKVIHVPASALANMIAKTVHNGWLDGCSGRGITVEVVATSPVDEQVKGFGVSFRGGVNTRKGST